MSVSKRGGGGTLTEMGATVQLVSTTNFTYIKAGAASWEKLMHNDAGAQLIADRWLKVRTADPLYSGNVRLTFSGKFLTLVTTAPGSRAPLRAPQNW